MPYRRAYNLSPIVMHDYGTLNAPIAPVSRNFVDVTSLLSRRRALTRTAP
jgi:hypothetical protein